SFQVLNILYEPNRLPDAAVGVSFKNGITHFKPAPRPRCGLHPKLDLKRIIALEFTKRARLRNPAVEVIRMNKPLKNCRATFVNLFRCQSHVILYLAVNPHYSAFVKVIDINDIRCGVSDLLKEVLAVARVEFCTHTLRFILERCHYTILKFQR